MTEEIHNPLMTYTINEDGVITVHMDAETGGQEAISFDNAELLGAAGVGFLDARYALNLFYEEGTDAAFDYVNEGAAKTSLTDDDLTAILDSPLDDEGSS